MLLFRSLWDEHGYHSDISDYKHEQMDQFQNLNQLDSRSSLQNNVQKSKGLSFALKTLGISDQSDNIQNQPPLMQYTNTSIAEMDIDPPPLRLDTNINELRQIRLNPISRQQKPIIPDSNYFNQMFKKPSEMNEIQLKPQRLFPTPVTRIFLIFLG
ncbi:hypothetical protein HDV02_003485 [Globomyces sp. JEL0801]|nr:hypothetical protein HDV02_003485 [Globomyces sp. JEL0801]